MQILSHQKRRYFPPSLFVWQTFCKHVPSVSTRWSSERTPQCSDKTTLSCTILRVPTIYLGTATHSLVGHACTHRSTGEKQQTGHSIVEQTKENMSHHRCMCTTRPKRACTRKNEDWHLYTSLSQSPTPVLGLYIWYRANRYGSNWFDHGLVVETSHHHPGTPETSTQCYCDDATESTHWVYASAEIRVGEEGMTTLVDRCLITT